ncbi:MAG: PTS system mannose/fructose/sorbose family transporter subunit IID, partial [Spirochaetia bacterium]|nr:PTS system mannose/fructose/sorbose family transporter subunit IID [Spirochaetia bacterium]
DGPEKREKFLAAIKRHTGFFNTHIFFSSAVIGVMARLEEDGQDSDQKAKETEIESMKMGIMGSLAAIGDALFWSGIKPLALLIGAMMVWMTGYSVTGWVVAAVTSLLVYNLPRIVIKYYLLFKSYFQYGELFTLIQKVKFQDIMKSIKVGGMGLLGAAMAVYLAGKDMEEINHNQGVGIVLFLAAFLTVTWSLRTKKSVSFIFAGVVISCILLAYIFNF